MFEYHQNILCVQGGWLYNDGDVMSKYDYKYCSRRHQLNILRRGCKGTPSLVEYVSLPFRFRKKIESRIGSHPSKLSEFRNNRNQVAVAMEYDATAASFYGEYTFEGGKMLPSGKQREYTATASILNTVKKVFTSRVLFKKALGGRSTGIWDQLVADVSELDASAWPHHLPTHVRRFRERYQRYHEEGYESIIHSNYCNNNSEKINKKAGMWVLSRWCDQVDKCANITQLFVEYNAQVASKGWNALLSEETLRNFLNREDIRHLWYGHRYGDAVSKEKFVYQHSTKLPSMRDSLWYADGTKVNYTYREQDEEGKWGIGYLPGI